MLISLEKKQMCRVRERKGRQTDRERDRERVREREHRFDV